MNLRDALSAEEREGKLEKNSPIYIGAFYGGMMLWDYLNTVADARRKL